MHTSNHSWSAGDRPALRVTPAGLSALAYFDYVNVRHFVSPDILFADTAVPERHDDDRTETDLERLHRELEEALEQMRQAGHDDDAFVVAARRVKALRAKIYALENTPDPAEDPEDLTGDPNFEQGRKDADEYFDDDDDDDPYDDNIIPPLQGNGGDDADDWED
jgi:hypothetical protein